MKNNFGILYVATGEQYRAECNKSAQSAKKNMPNIPISIWTDNETDLDKNCFNSINIIENPKYSFFDKISPLLETPYQKTLFLDTDTYLLDSVYEIQDLLDYREFACTHAPVRISFGDNENDVLKNIPICFPEVNTGVIAYVKNDRVFRLINQWRDIYNKQLKSDNPPCHDQPALRKALYYCDLHLAILPPEYNIRTIFPVFVGGNAKAKILHGRGETLKTSIEKINDYHGIRIYDFRTPE
jgi:hypothetical protein